MISIVTNLSNESFKDAVESNDLVHVVCEYIRESDDLGWCENEEVLKLYEYELDISDDVVVWTNEDFSVTFCKKSQ